jgi:phage pi2 protein 07
MADHPIVQMADAFRRKYQPSEDQRTFNDFAPGPGNDWGNNPSIGSFDPGSGSGWNNTSSGLGKFDAGKGTGWDNVKTNANPDALSPVQVGDVNGWGGVANVVAEPNAPLASLYDNPYATTSLIYPRDVGNAGKGHTVQFDIRDVVPFTTSVSGVSSGAQSAVNGFLAFSKALPLQTIGNQLSQTAGAVANAPSVQAGFEAGLNGTASVISSVTGAIPAGTTGSSKPISFNPETTANIVSSIRLYMPDTLNFSQAAQYDKLSVAEAVNSVPLVGAISRAINSGVGKLISNKLGYVFNPQQQMLFEGIDFREFDMEFVFTPTSKEEAQTIKDIITKFRYYAAPTINTSAGGFFFTPPSTFEISFFFNGQRNFNIAPIRKCVLQSVTVNYAPNGWAAMNDGAPVQTTLSLSFKEIELVDRTSIGREK